MKEKKPALALKSKDGFSADRRVSLFSFETVAASATFRVATANVADVDFAERAIIAGAVILTIGYAATNAGVYFLTTFVHHNKILLLERRRYDKRLIRETEY